MQLGHELRQRLVGRAVQVDRQALGGAALQHAQRERRAVDPVGELDAVQHAERPAHRLPVRRDQVERVEPGVVLRIGDAGHHAVHGERGQRERLAFVRGGDDAVGGVVVVDRGDHHAEDVVLALVDHADAATHLSTLAS